MSEPSISSFTFTKQRNPWVAPGVCYAVRMPSNPTQFIVLSREAISDMAAVSAINELIKAELSPQDDSHHMGPDD
jgi:hypothetical protein